MDPNRQGSIRFDRDSCCTGAITLQGDDLATNLPDARDSNDDIVFHKRGHLASYCCKIDLDLLMMSTIEVIQVGSAKGIQYRAQLGAWHAKNGESSTVNHLHKAVTVLLSKRS